MKNRIELDLSELDTSKAEIINLLANPQNHFNGVSGINARDVHRFLKVGRDYSTWIRARIKQAGFIENQDFVIVENLSSPELVSANNEQLSPMARPQKLIDYIISLDMAKHLCLMEKNEIGRAIRQHFIEAEKQLRTSLPAIYKNTLSKTIERLESIDRNKEMTDAIKAQLVRAGVKPKAYHYSQNQEMLDSLVIGSNVRKWKAKHGIVGNVRDTLNVSQLKLLKTLQATNTALINLDMSYHERKGRLSELAERERAA
ncbi:TPA: antA/AntB antirepressor family protein [Haemophilus influenzae]